MLSSNYNYAYKPHTIMKSSYEENRAVAFILEGMWHAPGIFRGNTKVRSPRK